MAKALCEGVFMGMVSEGSCPEQIHPLFQEVDGFSFDGLMLDVLHVLVDLPQSERISAVKKAIQRRMDPEKDMELLNWFRLLKRVYALEIIGDSQMGAEPAEEVLKRGFNYDQESQEAGVRYRTHLKSLYVELPDTMGEGTDFPVFALPRTKAWILGEIANGWSPHNYTESDRLECLLFLSATTDTLHEGNPYNKAFYRMRGWDEIRKCVRDILRARFKDFSPGSRFSEKEIREFLTLPMLSATIVSALWHGFIADMVEYEFLRKKLRTMLMLGELVPNDMADWPQEYHARVKDALCAIAAERNAELLKAEAAAMLGII